VKQKVSKSLLWVSVVFITSLLVLNIFATLQNNQIIEENRILQKEAEEVKVTMSQFAIIIIHNLDLGLRSYALYKEDDYLFPMRFAIRDKDSLMNAAEVVLLKHGYPIAEFQSLRDSINAYAEQCVTMLELIRSDNWNEFYRLSDLDKGYHLWLQYERFTKKVNQFEDEINARAQKKYRAALQSNNLIQIFLLVMCAPTLLFTTIHTLRKFKYEVRLRELEEEKTTILSSQNKVLEQTVKERTEEIENKNKILQSQYEEITAQNEEITAQNEELNLHREQLEIQNSKLVESKRRQLELYKTNLMEKSDLINKITAELEVLKKRFSPEPEHIEKFNRILHFNILTDEDWERFKTTFQEVYPNFFAGLRYRFPAITASELRLSALIKMNLSLREAADMLGISTSSVKKSRYRLKKRLGLKDEESLEDFIQKSV
jgi:hypothetical protein